MSTLAVDSITKADGSGSLSVPAETGTLVIKDASNDVTLNDITANSIFLGGTGAANQLDDYEEGEYTVTVTGLSSGSVTLDSNIDALRYIKIGRQVFINGRINVASVSSPSGQLKFTLPFLSSSSGSDQSTFNAIPIFTHGVNIQNSAISMFGEIQGGGSDIDIFAMFDAANWDAFSASNLVGNGNEYFYFNGHYYTDL